MVRFLVALLTGLILSPIGCAQSPEVVQDAQPAVVADELLTVAEKSGFKATARHAEVVALLDKLAEVHPKLTRRLEMGRTHEDRDIPVLVVADPPVGTPEEAVAAARGGKVIVLFLGNIHAGEVDGKEGLPMLAREVLATPDHPYLKDFVLVFAPIFNADGNERVSRDNRPGQDGPEQGMGQRHNAQDLDLNRDFIKLEAPETRALVRFVHKWDPTIIVDTHTTNGSYHRYIVTHAGPRTPTGDGKLIEFVRDTMLPGVQKIALDEYARNTFPYGDFNRAHTTWEGYPATARFLTSYFGLGNRITVLSEGYSYATYKDRVEGTRDFCKAILDYASANEEKVKEAVSGARSRTTDAGRDPKPEDRVAIRFRATAAPDRVVAQGFVEREENGRPVSTGEPKDYEVEIRDHFEPTLSVPRPFGYLLPPETPASIIEVLQLHGLEVEELREDLELEVEVYRIDSADTAERPFQGHAVRTVQATARKGPMGVPVGTFLVRAGQRLGNLAIYCLEPMCEDGLAAWNFFDEYLDSGDDFPVIRVPAQTPILSTKVRPLAQDRVTGKKVTFELLNESDSPPSFNGSPIGGFDWQEDGEHYVQSREGKTWLIEARTGKATPHGGDSDAMAKALAAIPTVGEQRANDWARGRPIADEKRTGALFTHENDLYYARFDGALAARLTSSPETEEMPSFSPNGEFVAFVRSNDLWVVDVRTQTERQLTTGGTDIVRNGKADWVYFEEIFGRNWRTYWWSPDSQRIAFLQVDSSQEPRYYLTDDRDYAQELEDVPYPKAGQPNPRTKVGLVTAAGGGVRWADLSSYSIDDMLISSVGWWGDSSGVYFTVQNRVQNWMDFCTMPPNGGPLRRLFRETTQAWVEVLGEPEFLKDGTFLFQSERDGWRHLYHYNKDGSLKNRLTEGEWEVRGVPRVDEEAGWVYFTGTKDSHIASNLYRVPLAGGEIQRLTHEPGSHGTTLPKKGTLFVDSWSSHKQPNRVVLRDAEKPMEVVRTLDSNPVYALEEYTLGSFELLQIPGDNGEVYEATLCKPADFDSARRYPVWFTTYGGPHAPVVSDSWSGGRTWDQVLATTGIIVLRADNSTASGKGAIATWPTYKQMGVEECADVERIINWARSQPWCDPTRIGMNGHSFGGFLTAYCMTHTDCFSAGIAGAPVTDWREYDSIYTERYMDTPQNNPDGYEKTSVIAAAKNLHGRLLILHGTIDDNVHPQNTIRLVRALQEANKPFEIMMYPGMRHGIFGKHNSRQIYDFIQRTMNGNGSEGSKWQPSDPGPATEGAADPAPERRRRGRRSRDGE